MPPRRRNTESKKKTTSVKGVIEGAGEVVEQPITDTLEKNYMPYAMSVIMSRAIPEIDGFKPSHRKLLYTMYKMGLLGSARNKISQYCGTNHEVKSSWRFCNLRHYGALKPRI